MIKRKNTQRYCWLCKYENDPHRRTVFQEPCKSCVNHSNFEELAEYIFDLGNGSEYCYGHCVFQDDKDCPFPHGCMLGVVKWLESEEWTE